MGVSELSGNTLPRRVSGLTPGGYWLRYIALALALLGSGATTTEAKPKMFFSTFLGSPEVDGANGIAVDSSQRSFVLSCSPDPARFASGATPLSPGGGPTDIVVTRLGKKGKIESMASFGGSEFEQCIAIALGPDPSAEGERLVYVLSATSSPDFPIRDAIQEQCGRGGSALCPGNLAITVLDSDLTEILFSTYLGGSGGTLAFFDDFGGDLAVDAAGRIAVVSGSRSKDFPTRRPTQRKGKGAINGVVSLLEPEGGGGYRLAFSTYLGGKAKKAQSHARSVAFHGNGRLVVVGFTNDRRFPAVTALQDGIGGDFDGFVTIYDLDDASASISSRKARVGDPEILHSTTFGGRDLDWFNDVVVVEDRIYLTGLTESPDFPTLNPFKAAVQGFDAVLAVFDLEPVLSSGASPEVIVSTPFGGRQFDEGAALAVDRRGRVHLIGTTFSRDLPVRSPVQQQCAAHPSTTPDCWDAFVARFEPIQAGLPPELRFSTFLGGPQVGTRYAGGEISTDVAVDPTGATYVAGRTGSPQFPTRKAAQKKFRDGLVDGFASKIKK